MKDNMLSALHWFISYLLSALVAGLVFVVLQESFVQGRPSSLLDPKTYSEAVFAGFIFSIVAAPSVFLLAAVPELLGAKPRIILWGMLGVLAPIMCLTWLEVVTSEGFGDFLDQVIELFGVIHEYDKYFMYLSYLVAGGCAGLFLGYCRKSYTT